MSRDLRDLLDQTARGPCDDAFDPAGIAVRARRGARAAAAVAAVVVLVVLAGGTLWIGSLGTTPAAPYVDASPPVDVPDTWQRVVIGNAELSVPGDWAVIDLDQDPTAFCTRFLGSPAVYRGSHPSPVPTCPPRQLEAAVGIQVIDFEMLGGDFGGDPVRINGHAGVVTTGDDGVRRYVFPDLALMLDVQRQPDPELVDQVLGTLRLAEQPSTEPTTPQPSSMPQASASREPTDLDTGPVLQADGLPPMASEGVAVQVPAGVVFVGLDGTVHGHLPGAELATGGPAASVAGPVPVHLATMADEAQDSRWIHPPSGSTAPLAPTTPLWGGHEVVPLATGLDPSPVALRRDDGGGGEELARFFPNMQWHVSSNHRVVSWHDCPDTADDLSSCRARAYDTDMGGRMDLEPGCWVSDSFADLNHAVVCWRSWGAGGASWIERHAPGPEAAPGPEVRRIEVPRYDDQPDDTPDIGHYVNAFLAGEDVVATWSTECEVPRPVVIGPDGVPRPLVGDDFTTAPTGVVLGTSRDGDAVLHVPADRACGQRGKAGIHLVDLDTGRTTAVLLTDGLTGAEMWSPQPQFDDGD